MEDIEDLVLTPREREYYQFFSECFLDGKIIDDERYLLDSIKRKYDIEEKRIQQIESFAKSKMGLIRSSNNATNYFNSLDDEFARYYKAVEEELAYYDKSVEEYHKDLEKQENEQPLKEDVSLANSNDNVSHIIEEGFNLFEAQSYDEAIACYDKAIKLAPNNKDAHYYKGNVLFEMGLYEEAVECYDHVIELAPNYTLAYYNKGNTLFGLARYDEAIICCDKVIELDPNYATSMYSFKANALFGLGRYEEAIVYYDKVIELYPEDEYAYQYKIEALSYLGRDDEIQAVLNQMGGGY